MSPGEFSRLRRSDRNRLFDAVVRLRPLVAVNTLDLGGVPPAPGWSEKGHSWRR